MNTRQWRAVAVIALSVAVIGVAGVLYLGPSIRLGSTAKPAPVPATITAPGETVSYYFVAPGTGWAAAALDSDNGIWIYQTHDGARSWHFVARIVFSGQRTAQAVLRFFDTRTGMLSVYLQTGMLAYRTADAGRSWTQIGLEPDTWAVVFTDGDHGWSTTVDAASGHTHLFATADGGRAWSALPDPPAVGYPDFANPDEGWLGGSAPSRTVYTTETGGRTWEAWQLPPAPDCTPFGKTCGGPLSGSIGVQALAHAGAIATDGDGIAFVTSDGGATWRFLQPPPPAGIYEDISRVDAVHWWVLRGNELYKTGDAGVTWQLVSNRVEYDTLHPVIIDAQHAWAVVQAEDDSVQGNRPRIGLSLVTTSDGGLVWKDATVPVPV